MKLAAELEASLREFVSAGAAELCENGGRLAPLSKLSWEVRGSDDKVRVENISADSARSAMERLPRGGISADLRSSRKKPLQLRLRTCATS
jgi:hypothetical protein